MKKPSRSRAWARSGAWFALPAGIAVCLLLAAFAFAAGLGTNSAYRADVTPREALEAYSWEELAEIGAEIGSCSSNEEAISRASQYGLCAADGTIDLGQTKGVSLADGTRAYAQLVSIWHDEKTSGGKAGLTFVLVDAASVHAMNHAHEDTSGDHSDSTGGWAASDMRSWLKGDYLLKLPTDLRSRIVQVQKPTANNAGTLDETDEPGQLGGAAVDWVGQTSDRLWLFSAAELCGEVPPCEPLGVSESMSRIYGAEGSQYRLFAQMGTGAHAPNSALADMVSGDGKAACTWWLRTKSLEFADGFWLVGTDGTLLNGLGEDARVVNDPEYAPDKLWGPDHARSIVVGFCL